MTRHPKAMAGDHVRVYAGSITGAPGTLTDTGSVLFDQAVTVAAEEIWPDVPYHPAAPADAFLDTLGVNVHMSYLSTPYANVDSVLGALDYAGIRHVRDGECSTCVKNGRIQQRALAAAGYRFTMIAGDFSSQPGHTLDGNVPAAISDLGDRLVAFEAINEPNRQRGYTMDAVVDLHKRLRQLAPAGVPIIGPAFTDGRLFAPFGAQAQQAATDGVPLIDQGNMHPYPGGAEPGKGIGANMKLAAKAAPGLRLVAGETGYHNAVNTTGGHRPASEPAAGVYMPRLFLEYFRVGVARTFIYELVDQQPEPALKYDQRHFGLFRNDWSPKPAADGVRNMVQQIGQGTPETVGGLAYQVRSAVAVRDVLLQRDTGEYVLILWRPVPVWDQAKLTDLPVTDRNVSVTFGQPVSIAGQVVRTLDMTMGADTAYLVLTAS